MRYFDKKQAPASLSFKRQLTAFLTLFFIAIPLAALAQQTPEPIQLLEQIPEAQPPPEETAPENIPETSRLDISRFEDGDYLFDLVLDRETIGQSIFAYIQKGQLYLSLTDFAVAIEFPIDVLAEEGLAEGWFIEEQRSFSLSIPERKIKLSHETLPLQDTGYHATPDDIYLSLALMEKIFPVVFKIDAQRLTIIITPTETLPQTARREREKSRWKTKGTRRADPSMPLIDTSYKALSMPSLDVDLQQSFSSGNGNISDGALQTRYNVLGHGDLLYGTGRMYLSGDENDKLRDLRLSVERVDPKEELGGPLGLSRFAAGDINSVRLPILSGTGEERGIVIQKNNLRGSSVISTQDFTGDATPGWEAELYRNGILLEFRDIGVDGKYEFLNIPLVFGRNDFEIIFYGPQGQKRSEARTLYYGPGTSRKGEISYEMSLTDQDETLFDFENNSAPNPDEGTPRLSVLMTYGLTDRAMLTTGARSESLDGEDKNYFVTGLSGNLAQMFATLNLAVDENGGYAVETATNKRWNNATIRLSNTTTDGFENETFGRNAFSPVNETRLDFDTRKQLSDTSWLYTNTAISHETLQNDDTRQRLRNNLTLRFPKASFSNNISGTLTDTPGQDDTFFGLMQLDLDRIKTKTIKPRMRLEYGLTPDTEIRSFSFSNNFPLSEQMSLTTTARKNFGSFGDQETISAGLLYNNGRFHILPQVTIDSDGNLSAQLGMRFSVLPDTHSGDIYRADPLARSGHLSALVYHDVNHDGIFDAGDKPLSDISVESVQTGQKGATSQNGIAILPYLTPYRQTDIALRDETLMDPSLLSVVEGYGVKTRPGKTWQVEFPLVTVGEIDGTILRNEKTGDNLPYPNVKIQLYNAEGKIVSEIFSSYDGFYLFEKVIPGTYVVLAQRATRSSQRRYESPAARVVIVPEDGSIQSGIDLYFIEYEAELELPPEQPKEKSLMPEDIKALVAAGPATQPPVLPWQRIEPPAESETALPEELKDTPQSTAPAHQAPQQPSVEKGYHLASHRSEEAARAYWQELAEALPDIFESYQPEYQVIHTGANGQDIFWRTIAMPKEPETNPNFLCKALNRMFIACSPMSIYSPAPENAPALKGAAFHLASDSTDESAREEWEEIKNAFPEILSGFEPVFESITVGGKSYVRLIVANPESTEDICIKLQKSGQYCKRLDRR